MKMPEKYHELDEAKKKVDHLKNLLQEANNRESTLTSQLIENPNKWNKHDKELGKQITSLKRELEEDKRIEEVLRSQMKQKEEDSR